MNSPARTLIRPLIRPSAEGDIPAIAAIYAHHVLHGTGTFETEPPTVPDMTSRRADVLAKKLPYLVIEQGGVIQGFAYANWLSAIPHSSSFASNLPKLASTFSTIPKNLAVSSSTLGLPR